MVGSSERGSLLSLGHEEPYVTIALHASHAGQVAWAAAQCAIIERGGARGVTVPGSEGKIDACPPAAALHPVVPKLPPLHSIPNDGLLGPYPAEDFVISTGRDGKG